MSKLMPQFITVAMELPLSCMISAMYNQVIGPGPNSKIIMKTKTPPIIKFPALSKSAHPTTPLMIASAAVDQRRRGFLPTTPNNAIPPKVAKKLTTPTIPVMALGESDE